MTFDPMIGAIVASGFASVVIGMIWYHPMVFGGRYRLFDVGGTIAIAVMTFILLLAATRTTCRLYREERLR